MPSAARSKATASSAWLVSALLAGCGEGPRSGASGSRPRTPVAIVIADDWTPVPAFVVDELPLARGSWKREYGWTKSGEELGLQAQVLEDGALEVFVDDRGGFSGLPLSFRLRATPAGYVSVQARSSWNADVGPPFSGLTLDLHGGVRIERRAAGAGAPLRLAFRLHGVEDESLGPVVTEGALELVPPVWDGACLEPAWVEPLVDPPPHLLAELTWHGRDGELLARGRVDEHGRRHGAWETFYANGRVQTACEFRSGERDGLWKSFQEDGQPFEQGRLVRGVRQGEWIAFELLDGRTSVERGLFVDGQKEGEWVTTWSNGTVRLRGRYEHGEEVGLWTSFWENGAKCSQGSPMGPWRFWAHDGQPLAHVPD